MFDIVEHNITRGANNTLVKRAAEVCVFGPISDGVLAEIKLAKQENKPLRYFAIVKS